MSGKTPPSLLDASAVYADAIAEEAAMRVLDQLEQSPPQALIAAIARELANANTIVVTPKPTPDPEQPAPIVPQPTPTPPAAKGVVKRLTLAVRGQSNGYFWNEFGHVAMMARMITDLTGIPVDVVSRQNNTPNTIFAGTGKFDWLKGEQGKRIVDEVARAYAMIDKDPENPVFDLELHWENDLKEWDGARIQAYPANYMIVRETIKQGAPVKAKGKYVTFIAHCPYMSGVQRGALNEISATWSKLVQTTEEFEFAVGNALDAWHQGDWSHWSKEGAERVARRIAVRLSRYCYDQKWTDRDLRHLPDLGPEIVTVTVDPADRTQVLAVVVQDAGNKLYLNDTPADSFRVYGNALDIRATSVIAIGGSGLIIKFPKEVPIGAQFTAYDSTAYMDTKVITDDFHEVLPGLCRSTLQRTWQPIKVTGDMMADDTIPAPVPPATPTPQPTPPAKVDWDTQARVVQEHYNKTGKWLTYDEIMRMQPSVPVSQPLPPPTKPVFPGINDAQSLVADFLALMDVGVNFERESIYAHTRAQHAVFRQAIPFSHARGFVPWRASGGFAMNRGADVLPSTQDVQRFVNAFIDLQAVGYSRALLDCLDIFDSQCLTDSRIALSEQVISMVCDAIIVAGLSPSFLAVGAVNEWAVSVTDTMRLLDRFNKVIRSKLPEHVLTYGSDGWKGWKNLCNPAFVPPADELSFADFHAYDQHDTNGWRWVKGEVDKWCAKHDRFAVFGEAGSGAIQRDETQFWKHPEYISTMLPVMEEYKPTLWAVTAEGMRHWSLNYQRGVLIEGQLYNNVKLPNTASVLRGLVNGMRT